MATPSDAEDWEPSRRSRTSRRFKLLSEDLDSGGTAPTASYLEAFSAWLDESYLGPGALFAEFRPEPTWREFARMLSVARAYE